MQHEAWLGEQRWVRSDTTRARAAAWANRLADERFIVVFATILGAVLRLPTLGAKSLWYDELISISIARNSASTILRARLRFDAGADLIDRLFTNNPPLHLLLIHAVRTVSTAEAAMRLPFALAGVATIPIAFAVLKRLLGFRAAAFGAFLLVISPLHISYSQEARPTVLLVLFSLTGLLFLLRAVDSGRRADWICFVLFALLNVWSSYFAAIAIFPTFAAIWLILIVSQRRRLPEVPLAPSIRAAILAGAAIVLGSLPWRGMSSPPRG